MANQLMHTYICIYVHDEMKPHVYSHLHLLNLVKDMHARAIVLCAWWLHVFLLSLRSPNY